MPLNDKLVLHKGFLILNLVDLEGECGWIINVYMS
jgi:hypothetical protein